MKMISASDAAARRLPCISRRRRGSRGRYRSWRAQQREAPKKAKVLMLRPTVRRWSRCWSRALAEQASAHSDLKTTTKWPGTPSRKQSLSSASAGPAGGWRSSSVHSRFCATARLRPKTCLALSQGAGTETEWSLVLCMNTATPQAGSGFMCTHQYLHVRARMPTRESARHMHNAHTVTFVMRSAAENHLEHEHDARATISNGRAEPSGSGGLIDAATRQQQSRLGWRRTGLCWRWRV
jgi:hypothetical protein